MTPCSLCLPGVYWKCRNSIHRLLSFTTPHSSSALQPPFLHHFAPAPLHPPLVTSSSCSSSQPSMVNLTMPPTFPLLFGLTFPFFNMYQRALLMNEPASSAPVSQRCQLHLNNLCCDQSIYACQVYSTICIEEIYLKL